MRNVETDDCSGYVYCVQCTNCEASSGLYGSKEQACAAWNRRVAEKPKWTKEPPSEVGWYLEMRNGVIDCVEYEDVRFKDHLGVLEKFWRATPEQIQALNILWYKIPIPALPKEGEYYE